MATNIGYEEMMRRARECQEKLKNDPIMDKVNNWALKNVKKPRTVQTTESTSEWLTRMIRNLDD